MFRTIDRASQAVHNEAHSNKVCVMRNCRGESGTKGTDSPLWTSPGLETIKDRMMQKVIVAPRLPTSESLGHTGASAVSIPIPISVMPIKAENILVIRNLRLQERKMLFSARGRIASASCWVNLSAPTPIRISAREYLSR